MFGLKGCTPVRKPVNKDTGCEEEGAGGRSGTVSLKADL